MISSQQEEVKQVHNLLFSFDIESRSHLFRLYSKHLVKYQKPPI